ncbi:MAG TPA: type I-U CRISPR-associated protein Csb2, partial [Schlesneria sp.]
MKSSLCFSLRFLDPVPQFHGRGPDGDPEWPPSPLRFFQAIVSASAQLWRDSQFRTYASPALKWLESIDPAILTPEVAVGSFGYRMYVPNNSGDLMTAAWARGDVESSMAKFRVEKDVRPINLHGEAVRFLYPLSDGDCPHLEVLKAAARSVTHLGWGINMVAGNAEILTEAGVTELEGEVWRPSQDSQGTALRVPVTGTLDALVAKHEAFLERIGSAGFKPVPPLSAFRIVGYRRATEPANRPFAALSILKPDASGMRAFDSRRRTRDVAGMIRHAVATTARDQAWSSERINIFIHGKTPDGSRPSDGQMSPDRFQYLPLPSINHIGKVGSIRRLLVTAPAHCHREINWVRRAMAG